MFSTLISLSKKEAPGAETVRSTCFLKNAALHAAFGIKLLIYIKKNTLKRLDVPQRRDFQGTALPLRDPGAGAGAASPQPGVARARADAWSCPEGMARFFAFSIRDQCGFSRAVSIACAAASVSSAACEGIA